MKKTLLQLCYVLLALACAGGVIYMMVHYTFRDDTQGIERSLRLAEEGDPKHQYRLAKRYVHDNDLPPDEEKAAYWFLRAAEQGYEEAEYKMGELYAAGKGVEKDLEKARQWYRRAAEHGNSFAEMALLELEEVAMPQHLAFVTREEFSKYYTGYEALLHALEEELPAYAHGYKDDSMYYNMARIYAHNGRMDEALHAASEVKALLNRRFMLEVYAGILLEYLQHGEIEKAFAMLESGSDIANQISGLDQTPLPKPVAHYRRNSKASAEYVEYNLCNLAANQLLFDGRQEEFRRLYALKACAKNSNIGGYAMASLLLRGEYAKAFDMFMDVKAHTEKEKDGRYRMFHSGAVLSACLPLGVRRAAVQARVDELLLRKEWLLKDADDMERHNLVYLLIASGALHAAEELVNSMDNKVFGQTLSVLVLTEYLKQGKRGEVLRILEGWKAFDAVPLPDRDPGQDNLWWHDVVRPEARALAAVAQPISYEIAMKYKNPRTRFTVLQAISMKSKGKEVEAFDIPGCGDNRRCVLDAMAEIAAAEQDNVARDYMYSEIVKRAKRWGWEEDSKAFTTRMVNPHRYVCRDDMCAKLLPFMPPDALQNTVQHLAMCEGMIAASKDGLLSVFAQIDDTPPDAPESSDARKAREEWSQGKPSRAVREADLLKSEEKQKEGRRALDCHIVTGAYKNHLAEPARLGALHDMYLQKIALTSDTRISLQERFYAALMIRDRKIRKEIVSTLLPKGGEAEAEGEVFAAMDQYMQAFPVVFQTDGLSTAPAEDVQDFVEIWSMLLNMGAKSARQKEALERDMEIQTPKERIAAMRKVLSQRPQVRAFLAENAAYHGIGCVYMENEIPQPQAIIKTEPEKQKRAFRECVLNLIDAEKYGQALYLAQHMFLNGSYSSMTKAEILLHELSLKSRSFRMSSLDKPFSSEHADYPFVEKGFPFATETQRKIGASGYRCMLTEADNVK